METWKAAFSTKKALVADQREALKTRTNNLSEKAILLQKMQAVVNEERAVLNEKEQMLAVQEELFETIESCGCSDEPAALKAVFSQDPVHYEHIEGPAGAAKRRRLGGAESYSSLRAAAERELAAEARARAAILQEQAALDARLGALRRERGAAQEERRRGDLQLRAFAREYYRAPAQKLPDEMLRGIFSFLSGDDLVTAGQVCSTWRSVVKDPMTWRHLCPIVCLGKNLKERKVFCRILRALPHLQQVCVTVSGLQQLRNCPEILKVPWLTVLTQKCFSIPPFLRSYTGQPQTLRLTLNNVDAAMWVDSRFVQLRRFVVRFSIGMRYKFNKSFTHKSTLHNLYCKDAHPETLESIIAAHCKTLRRIAVLGSSDATSGPAVSLALQKCPQLQVLHVACSTTELVLPPWCTEAKLLVHRCRLEAACPGCAVVSSWRGLARLHVASCSLARLRAHLRQLDQRFLESLQEVSLYCSAKEIRQHRDEVEAMLRGRRNFKLNAKSKILPNFY